MALAIANSRGLDGLNAPPVIVEVHIASGLPSFTLVGLPDTEVKEARDRVRAAILNSGFEFPSKRITVNLAPADLPKESGRFDLPIALGILAASSQIPTKALADYEFAGELSLSGELRPIRGALAMALQIADNGKCFILPETSAREAALTGAGNRTCSRPALSCNAWLLLLMSSLVQPKCTNSPAASNSGRASNFDLSQYSTALTSWLVVLSMTLMASPSASEKCLTRPSK